MSEGRLGNIMDEEKTSGPGTNLETPPLNHSDLPLPLPAQPPPFPERVRNFFVGPGGLRVGWRCALYFALWGGLLLLLDGLVHWAEPHGVHGIWRDPTTEVECLVATLVAALAMMVIEKRHFGAYGLPRRGAFGKLFWVGAVWGIAGLSLLMLAIGAAGDFTLGGLALHGIRILKFAAFWGFFFLLVGLFEEFFFRGYPQFTLSQGMDFWPAALLLSFIFGCTHMGNFGESWVGAACAGFIGLFFCLTLRRTGNLWFAVGCHASWDWGESFLYSVPDSGELSRGHLLNSSFHGSRWLTGGSVGPEGSLLVFVVIALMWVAFDRMYPRRRLGR